MLINKAVLWKYNDEKFLIPFENGEGAIELQGSRKQSKVLGLRALKKGPRAFGYKVTALKRDIPASDEQTWLRTPIDDTWFTLRNKATGRFLTSRDNENVVVAGTFYSKYQFKNLFLSNYYLFDIVKDHDIRIVFSLFNEF